jgi:hypothetical protein
MKASNLIRVATAAALLAFGSGAFAQSTVNVDVTVALTSKCQWTGGTAPTGLVIDFGTYTAFQTGSATPATPPTFTVQCTRKSTTPTASWDSPASTTVAGLAYSLSAPTSTTVTGAAATGGTGAGADTVTFTLGGSIAGGQAGDATASNTVTRTLTMSF